MKENRKKVYPYLISPEKYPLFEERYAKAVTRKVLDDEIQFTTLRVLTLDENNRLKNLEHDIAVYVDQLQLGKVLWPIYTNFLADNFNEYVDMVVDKNLYIFDIWGYVPGCRSKKDVIWGEYSAFNENLKYLKKKLGDRFLGFDNGEQDGRYVGSFSKQHLPLINDRKAQYKNFQKHFQKLGDAMQNYMVTLASLTFLHYFAKEGNTIMLGAETGQALPNNNMWFSFIRGAAKQYGFLYFGNASIWNRWGYKSYESEGKESGYEWGPECGTSLSLLRRLMYSHYIYNCDILGFEQSWVEGDNTEKRMENQSVRMDTDLSSCVLTPIGKIQRQAIEFVKKNGRPGINYTPLAIMADFYSGWVPPRHLYTGDVYKVWGNLPYEMGDYQLDLLFSMLYPGYENAGFYRDERGFLCTTPYGDIADVLLSDASGEIIRQYNTLIVTSGTELTYELFDKLKCFAECGGHVILFADTVKKYYSEIRNYTEACGEFFGLDYIGEMQEFNAAVIEYKENRYSTDILNNYVCSLSENASVVVAMENGTPVIIETNLCKGKVTVLLSDSGIVRQSNGFDRTNEPDSDLARPYELLKFISDYIGDTISELAVIKPDNPLVQYSLCIKDEQEFTLLVSNNTYETQGFDICTVLPLAASVEELLIEDDVKTFVGYFPKGIKVNNVVHKEKQYTIEGGDVKIFRIRLEDKVVEYKEESLPASKKGNVYLTKPRNMDTVKAVVLNHPEFNQHFSGILINAEYLERADIGFCRAEAEYLGRQKVKILIDFTPILNQYVDLSLIKNLPDKHSETIARISFIIEKAALYEAKGLIFSLHKNAECNLSVEEAVANVTETLSEIERIAAGHGIKVYVQNRHSFISDTKLMEILYNKIPAIKFVYNFSNGICDQESQEVSDRVLDKESGISGCLLSSPFEDEFGQLYNTNFPLYNGKWTSQCKELFSHSLSRNTDFIVLYADYKNKNEIYSDVKLLQL